MTVEEVEIGKYVKVVGGYAFKSKDFDDQGSPVIRISNIGGGDLLLDNVAKIPSSKLGKGKDFGINPGDILIAMSGATTGKIGVVLKEINEVLYQNQRVGNFKVNDEGKLHKAYLRYFIESPIYQSHIWNYTAGCAQPNVSGSQLESIKIPLPPLKIQKQISAVLEKADALRQQCQQVQKKLDSLVQSVFLEMFGDPVTNPKGWETKNLPEIISSEKYSMKRGPFGGALKKEIFLDTGY